MSFEELHFWVGDVGGFGNAGGWRCSDFSVSWLLSVGGKRAQMVIKTLPNFSDFHGGLAEGSCESNQ